MTSCSDEASSFSATFHEYRIYLMEPSGLCEYLDLGESKLQALKQDCCGCLLGFWYGEIGSLYQVHHLWRHETFESREAESHLLAARKDWQEEFLKKARPLMRSQDVRFLKPSLVVKPAVNTCSFYEMRRYQAVVGKADVLMQHVMVRPRSKGSTLSGVWTCVSPDPAEVLELIAYPDLASRREDNCPQVLQRSWLQSSAGMIQGSSSSMLWPLEISPLR